VLVELPFQHNLEDANIKKNNKTKKNLLELKFTTLFVLFYKKSLIKRKKEKEKRK
jgi:hypothetical protein